MAKPIDIDKPIPTLESVSPTYSALLARRDALVEQAHALAAEGASVKDELAIQQRTETRNDPVAALVAGITYEVPAPVMERLGNIERKRRLIDQALSEIGGKLVGERLAASRLAVAAFLPEQKALVTECVRHIADAVAAHSKLGKLRDRLERAGLDTSSLHDPIREILGGPNRRDDHAGYLFRAAVSRGYIDKSAVPGGYL